MAKYPVRQLEDMLPEVRSSFIGTGLAFPIQWGANDLKTNTGVEHIRQSIREILNTHIGERLFNPEFGSRLYQLAFEPEDFVFREVLIRYTRDAIDRWEPRVSLIDMDVDISSISNTAYISLNYKIIGENVEDNFVFPFKFSGMPSDNLVRGNEVENILNPGEIR